MQPKSVFISHASADDSFVAELRQALERHGIPVWVDSRNCVEATNSRQK